MSALSQAAPASITRPGTLTAAIGAAVVTALAAIADAVIILTGGLDLVKEVGNQIIAEDLGVSEAEVQDTLDFAGPVVDSLYEEAHRLFQNRAYLILASGVLLLLFGLLMRKGGMAFRILVTIAALPTIAGGALIATDAGTTMMIALGWVAVVGSLVAIVLTWLPANGRYAKAVR